MQDEFYVDCFAHFSSVKFPVNTFGPLPLAEAEECKKLVEENKEKNGIDRVEINTETLGCNPTTRWR